MYENHLGKNKTRNQARRLTSHTNLGLLFNNHKRRKPSQESDIELPNLQTPTSFEPD